MICPFASWRPVANHGGAMAVVVRGFIPHVQVGNGSLYNRFNDPSAEVSSHFWISKTGLLEQHVDSDMKAWAQAAGNAYFWSCEFEGFPDEAMTPAQLDKGGQLVAWLRLSDPFPLVVNMDPSGSGITPHRAGGEAWGGHSCPGDLRLGQYPDLILATLRHMDEQVPLPPHPQEEDDDMRPLKVNLPDGSAFMVFPTNSTYLQLDGKSNANVATLVAAGHVDAIDVDNVTFWESWKTQLDRVHA